MDDLLLQAENVTHAGTGGRSQENRCYGFQPAFLDSLTRAVYPCRFADGRLAPFHILDGLPEDAKPSLVSGFVLHDRFFTREEAAAFAQG